MNKTILGVFNDKINAENAIDDLKDLGYNPKNISVIMKNRKADFAGGVVSGATTGGIIGGIAGLLVGTGVFPGLGTLLIGGPLAVALGLSGAVATTVSGAATGAIAGGIIGILTKLGVTKEEAGVYENRIKEGAVLLAVPAYQDEEDEVKMVLENHEASEIKTVSDKLGGYVSRDQEEEMMDEEEPYYREPAYVGTKGGRAKKTNRSENKAEEKRNTNENENGRDRNEEDY